MPADLIEALSKAVGDDVLVTSGEALEDYGYDSWPVSVVDRKLGRNPHRPEVGVRARSTQDVVDTVAVAREFNVPVTARGLGSSVTGQPLTTRAGIVLDLSGITGAPELDEVNLTVSLGAGTRGSDAEAWLAERGYTLNHYPQSLGRSSVAGWLATRATGQLSSRYGGIEDLVAAYTVVLADGDVVDVRSRPRAAVGPDLRGLFLGSEGTLGIIVAVTLKVFPTAEHRRSEAFTLPDVASGLEVMRTIARNGLRPALLRFYDADETSHAVPDQEIPGCALFLATEGVPEVAEAEHAACAEILAAHGGTSLGPGPVEAWYGRRFDFSTVESLLAEPGGYAETIEVAHLWSEIGVLHTALRTALAPLADEVLGHFSHLYTQGTSLYVILLGRAADDGAAAARLREIWHTAMTVTLEHGGELSHHHGAGLARQEFIARSLGGQHEILRRIKAALDPRGLLNPGKLDLG